MVYNPDLYRRQVGVALFGPAEYLLYQISAHSQRFFSAEACHSLQAAKVRFLPYSEATACRERMIAIPVDIAISLRNWCDEPYHVPFNGTRLTLWNRLPFPGGVDWTSIPSSTTPLWYRHKTGTLIPAWNLFGNLFSLLTFQEEIEISQRDEHGRYLAAYSPRSASSLLEVPAFNEATAVMVAAALGMLDNGFPRIELGGHVLSPVVLLSHDLDALRGNDFWTQAIRAYRMLRPLAALRLPDLRQLRWILLNYTKPQRHYADAAIEMMDLERGLGYTSSFFFINGKKGRLGARSGDNGIPHLAKRILPGWEIGIHYNYDTLLNDWKFAQQKRELERLLNSDITHGRAHYLRFDARESFGLLTRNGIAIDESVGFPDRVGYRCGIGGCFVPYDAHRHETIPIYEIPLTIMDLTLVGQYGEESVNVFNRMLSHMQRVGGAISFLLHPNMFRNAEFPEYFSLYHEMLQTCRSLGAITTTRESLTGPSLNLRF